MEAVMVDEDPRICWSADFKVVILITKLLENTFFLFSLVTVKFNGARGGAVG
jgi:hypothetical protein